MVEISLPRYYRLLNEYVEVKEQEKDNNYYHCVCHYEYGSPTVSLDPLKGLRGQGGNSEGTKGYRYQPDPLPADGSFLRPSSPKGEGKA